VRLIDKTTTLYTQHLFYDRNLEIGHYPDSGRIVDKDNTLTSRNGYYFSRPREYRFRENVVLQNPDYVLVTDTLDYDTKTRIAYVKGPYTITGKERYVYAEDGWYDTQNEIFSLKTHVFIRNKDRKCYWARYNL
jgi:lipopolysaccharide assembly outer membrane protein LptD (OstA)